MSYALARGGRVLPPPPRPTWCESARVQSVRWRCAQHEPGELGAATATATIVRRLPRSSVVAAARVRCSALLGLSRQIAITLRAVRCLAALERLCPARGRFAVVPGGLDEQPAGVTGSGLGDRSLAARLAAGVLARAPARGSSSAPGAARSAESRRPRRTARPRRACRCRAGTAACATVCAHGEPGTSSPIVASSASRRITIASIAPR